MHKSCVSVHLRYRNRITQCIVFNFKKVLSRLIAESEFHILFFPAAREGAPIKPGEAPTAAPPQPEPADPQRAHSLHLHGLLGDRRQRHWRRGLLHARA